MADNTTNAAASESTSQPTAPAPLPTQAPTNASDFFAMFGNPLRWKIVKYLADGEVLTATQVAEKVGRDYDGMNKHLRLMRDAGVICVMRGADKRYDWYYVPKQYRAEPGHGEKNPGFHFRGGGARLLPIIRCVEAIQLVPDEWTQVVPAAGATGRVGGVESSCTRSELHMDVAAIRKLADGSLLQDKESEKVSGVLTLLDPAEYPTDLMHAVFEFLRKTNSVRAAWVFKHIEPSGKICYVFILDAPDNQQAVESELELIARLGCPKNAEWGLQFLDLNNPEMARIPKEFSPFYRNATA